MLFLHIYDVNLLKNNFLQLSNMIIDFVSFIFVFSVNAAQVSPSDG